MPAECGKGVADRSPSRENIVDDKDARCFGERRSATELPSSSIPANSFRICGVGAELARHFKSKNDAAGRGANDNIYCLA